jgi:hypothetical protein
MKLPRGRLVRSRVVRDPGTVLRIALDRSLTGYAVLELQDSLLFDDERRGVVTFTDGVPVLAYDTESDRGGTDALADFAVPGPYSADLFRLDPTALEEPHDTPELRVPPGVPAEELADDPDLAAETRDRAPDDRLSDADDGGSAVAASLEDESKIDAIREEARTEAPTGPTSGGCRTSSSTRTTGSLRDGGPAVRVTETPMAASP